MKANRKQDNQVILAFLLEETRYFPRGVGTATRRLMFKPCNQCIILTHSADSVVPISRAKKL